MSGKSDECLRLGLPKGSLQETTAQLFEKAGYNISFSGRSYYPEIDDLYVFASGTSFHQNIFPAETLDLGFSATASHYISSTPCNISDHVHMVGASGAEREAFTKQGAADWQTMLLQGTRELKPGGRLSLFNFGFD